MDTTGAPDTPPASAGPEPPPRPNPFAALEQPQDLEAVPEEDEFVDTVNEDEPVIMVNYDMRNETKEPADIVSKLNSIKVEWETKEDRRDIQFYFSQLEQRMQCAGVTKQWTKRLVLSNNLPMSVQNEVKNLLRLQEDAAGTTPYKTVKDRIIKIYGPKKEKAITTVLGLTLTTTLSQLARQMMDLLCRKDPSLQDCCCEGTISGLWRRMLAEPKQQAIAGMDMATNLEAVLQRADDVFDTLGGGHPQLAGATGGTDPQLAAFAKKNQQGNKTNRQGGQKQNQNRNQGAGGSGNQSRASAGQKRNRGPKHVDNPPDEVCFKHHKYGRSAWWCQNRKLSMEGLHN